MSFTKINITNSYSNMGNSIWNAEQNAWQEREGVGNSIYYNIGNWIQGLMSASIELHPQPI